MEAAGGSRVAGSDMAPLFVDATNPPVKKKYKARKTMTASCRQQMASLKLKHSSRMENSLQESLIALPTETSPQPDLICETSYTAQDISASTRNKSQANFPTGLQVSIEVSQVDPEFSYGRSYNETWKATTKHSKDLSSVLVTPVKNAIHFSHNTHFPVNGASNAVDEPQHNDLTPVYSPAVTESHVFSEEPMEVPDGSTVQDFKKLCKPADVDDRSHVSEKLDASLTLKIVAEDNLSLEKTSSGDLVTPSGDLGSENINAVLPADKHPASCDTKPSVPSNINTNLPTNLESDKMAQNCSPSEDGCCQRKRTISESCYCPETKRSKTSQKTLLHEIQSLVETRLQAVFTEAFDQRLQDLAQQVNLIQGVGNHADKFARHLKHLKRLEKRIKQAVEVHSELSNRTRKLPPISSASEELSKAEPLVASNTVQTVESEISPSRNPTTECLYTDPSVTVTGDNESEQQSKPEQMKSDNSLVTKKVDHAVMEKIMESIKEHRKLSPPTDNQTNMVIDLTDEEEKISNKGLNSNESSSPHENLFPSPAPTLESVEDKNLSNTNSEERNKKKENSLKRSNDEASTSNDTSERQQSVHKSTNSKESHDSADSLKTSTKPDTGFPKLPQKPELRLAQVQNPKGIALSWTVTSIDPDCSPAVAYCLYVHQEDPKCPKKLWKKIGEIKALPLPMACTLTQFVDDTTYNFALRAKDAWGRFGPLCDIQSTTVKPSTGSKII